MNSKIHNATFMLCRGCVFCSQTSYLITTLTYILMDNGSDVLKTFWYTKELKPPNDNFFSIDTYLCIVINRQLMLHQTIQFLTFIILNHFTK